MPPLIAVLITPMFIFLYISKNDIRPYCFGNNLLIERTFNVTKGGWAIYFYGGDNDEKYFFNKVFSTKNNGNTPNLKIE